jgi:hypothetical protein
MIVISETDLGVVCEGCTRPAFYIATPCIGCTAAQRSYYSKVLNDNDTVA